MLVPLPVRQKVSGIVWELIPYNMKIKANKIFITTMLTLKATSFQSGFIFYLETRDNNNIHFYSANSTVQFSNALYNVKNIV